MVDASKKGEKSRWSWAMRDVGRGELHEGLSRDRQGTMYNSGVLLGHAITAEEIPSAMAPSQTPALRFGNSSDLLC